MKLIQRLFIASIILLTACSPAKTLVQYESLGNSFASISLELKSNNKFKLNVDPIKDPSTPKANDKDFNIKGEWKQESNKYILTFKGDVDVKSLFDPQYTQGKQEVTFIDDKTISFASNRKTLTIWGVVCEIKKTDE